MKPDYPYMRVKAAAISLGIAICFAYVTLDGSGGCDGGLCAFNLLASFFRGFFAFLVAFIVIYKIIKYHEQQKW